MGALRWLRRMNTRAWNAMMARRRLVWAVLLAGATTLWCVGVATGRHELGVPLAFVCVAMLLGVAMEHTGRP